MKLCLKLRLSSPRIGSWQRSAAPRRALADRGWELAFVDATVSEWDGRDRARAGAIGPASAMV